MVNSNKKLFLKDMKCDAYKLKVGDIVITDDESDMYVILEINHTLFHNHVYYEVLYLGSGLIYYWMAEKLRRIKNIKRLIN